MHCSLPNFLLGPCKVAPHFLGRPHTFGEISLRATQSTLRKSLELRELALLGVQFARTVKSSSMHDRESRRATTADLRLRLLGNGAIHRIWICGNRQPVGHHLEQVDTLCTAV